jgi:hypothetical protein
MNWRVMVCFGFVLMSGLSARGAVFVVTNSGASGAGTLDQAVADANTSPPPNLITFNISGPVPVIIAQNSGLLITQPMTIDATTQPGYADNAPAIWLSGASAGPVAIGFNILTSGCVVSGFRIQDFAFYGVQLGASSNRVESCHIFSNSVGVVISGGIGNRLGGQALTNRNIISGNSTDGVQIYGPSTSNNVINGNMIGVSPFNSGVRMPNGGAGINIQDSPGNSISGTGAVLQVISGNAQEGINVTGVASVSNRISGNSIGGDHFAGSAVSNGLSGIYISDASYTYIGGTNAGDRNYILGNGRHGVEINFTTSSVGTRIEGNTIGMDSGGMASPNALSGIILNGGNNPVIGGEGGGQGNFISGNLNYGVFIGSQVDNGVIQGNVIGLDSVGNAVSNTFSGIFVQGDDWLIGGTNSGARNIISGNGQQGVHLNFTSGCVIQGNRIGVDAAGNARPNGQNGIYVIGGVDNLIGGLTSNAANIIAGNGSDGLYITGGMSNNVKGNLIGLLPNSVAVSNKFRGVYVELSSSLNIGGSTPGERNVISGNGSANIELSVTSTQVVIRGNFIGTGLAGTSSVYYTGINNSGITARGRDHIIGGTNAGEGNLISGNGNNGLSIIGSGMRVQGNIIGLASNGLTMVSNRNDGITLALATNNYIGGTTPLARNIISGNSRGIDIESGRPTLNTIVGNYIGLGRDGTTVVLNTTSDIIFSQGGRSNQIGGRMAGEGNVMGRIIIQNVDANHNVFEGNYIAINSLGRLITNLSEGVIITGGASSNLFGGSAKGAGNVVGGASGAFRVQATNSNGNRFEGNLVGVWTNGARLGTNDSSAVGFLLIQGQYNIIGGTNPAAGNMIGYYSKGIEMFSSNRCAFLGNTIISNSSTLAIDLGADNLFSGNDVLDVDGGVNDGQNHPTVTNVLSFFGSTFAQGFLSSKASSSYRIEFFSSPAVGIPQAIRFLGFTNVTTAANGTGTFAMVLGGYTPTGYLVRATATDANGNTSEIGAGAFATPATDTDNDKMPNYWETFYGLNPAVSNSPTADADGDGTPDQAEYVADTNPSDANSTFEFVEIASVDAGQSVTFPSSANRLYDVDRIADLVLGTWVNIATNMPGSGNPESLIDAVSATTNNYRARAKIPGM